MVAKMISKLSMILSMDLNLVARQCEVSPTFSKYMKLNFIRMAAYRTKLPTLQVHQKGSSFHLPWAHSILKACIQATNTKLIIFMEGSGPTLRNIFLTNAWNFSGDVCIHLVSVDCTTSPVLKFLFSLKYYVYN